MYFYYMGFLIIYYDLSPSYGNGHVLVCDIVKRSIIQQYKSHLDEIHSVVWQPSSTIHGYTGKDYSNGMRTMKIILHEHSVCTIIIQ